MVPSLEGLFRAVSVIWLAPYSLPLEDMILHAGGLIDLADKG